MLIKEKNIAIIPARGGSKRIPRKNIKPFLGKPIIVYTIEAAIASQCFDEVMVSTDDEEIAEISLKYGAKVPFLRSKKNANDHATTADALLEVLERYKELGRSFDNMCCLYATAPFITKDKLLAAYKLLLKNSFDSVFPVVPFSFPIQRAVHVSDNGQMKMVQKKYMMTRSQDLKSAYHDVGQFYWANTSMFVKEKKIWTDNSGVVITNELESQDIDTPLDWKLAELKYKLLNEL